MRLRHSLTAIGLCLLPWLMLLATLGVTWVAWNHEQQSRHKEMRVQFDFALRETVSRIEQRVVAYEQMLRGVQGLLATTDFLNRRAVHDYVEALQLDANFSGIRVIGLVQQVPLAHRAEHVSAMRRAGVSDYAIHPDQLQVSYAPVIQREPDAGRFGRNNVPLGLDLWADPVRRLAMERARDSGMAAISGKVRLAVDTSAKASPGFIMYLPVYARGQAHDSVAQRRTHLIGWVYAAFHMDDFMASLYGKQLPGLSLSVYDEVTPGAAALLYRLATTGAPPVPGTQPALRAQEYMVVAGHTWTLEMGTQAEFETRMGRDGATLIALTGIGLSLALALLVWLMVTGRARALRLAAAMTEELRQMALHDPLTKLPNRALFSDRLSQELARVQREPGQFSLVFLDLDNFKPVNDNFGHAVGDQLLQQVAQRLQAAIRGVDTAARIGGDEFVVLVTGLSHAGMVLVLAEKIRQTLRQPFVVQGHSLQISGSLGVAVYPDDGLDEISLTKSADDAMYRAKSSGRDTICSASPQADQPR
jgi:diguanylate cyclase (GGDEF)-like protein